MANNRIANALGRFADAITGPSRQKLENEYLERSTSIYDLERRMEEINRGKFRNF